MGPLAHTERRRYRNLVIYIKGRYSPMSFGHGIFIGSPRYRFITDVWCWRGWGFVISDRWRIAGGPVRHYRKHLKPDTSNALLLRRYRLMFNMLIHCTTLGSTPHISNIHNSFAVTPETPIEHIWNWTATCAQRNGSIKNLLIACHGLYWKLAGASTGGLGIKLGTGLYKDNVHLTAKLQPWVYNIYLYVCGGSAS